MSSDGYQGSQWSGWMPTEYLSTASASESFSSSYVRSQMTRARYLRDLYSCWWRHACRKHVIASTPVFMFLHNTKHCQSVLRWVAIFRILTNYPRRPTHLTASSPTPLPFHQLGASLNVKDLSLKLKSLVLLLQVLLLLQLYPFYGSLDFVWDYPGNPVPKM